MSNRLRKHAPRHEDKGLDPVDLAKIAGVITDAQHGTKTTIPSAHHDPFDWDKLVYYLMNREVLWSFFESIDNWLTDIVPSGYITSDIFGLILGTGTTAGGSAEIKISTFKPPAADVDVAFNVVLNRPMPYSNHYLGNCGNPSDLTKNQFGFKVVVVEENVYATSSDNVAEETTVIYSDIGASWGKHLWAKLYSDGSKATKVEFYGADFGEDYVLLATHTAHVPSSGWGMRLWMKVSNPVGLFDCYSKFTSVYLRR